MIQAYFNQVKAILDQYTAVNFVLDSTISFEQRPGNQGYLHGTIIFVDKSRFFFREYLDAAAEQVDKLAYAYHYQDADDNLLFRYDNAPHKPALPFQDHKHIDHTEIIQVEQPTLDHILSEIAQRQGWI